MTLALCMIFAVNGTTGLNMAGYDIKRFHRKLSTDNDWVIFLLLVIAIPIVITIPPGERANPRKTCQGLLASLPKVIIVKIMIMIIYDYNHQHNDHHDHHNHHILASLFKVIINHHCNIFLFIITTIVQPQSVHHLFFQPTTAGSQEPFFESTSSRNGKKVLG